MIKQWHALLALVLTPYFFYFITPVNNSTLKFINVAMTIILTVLFAAIAFDKNVRNDINKELEK